MSESKGDPLLLSRLPDEGNVDEHPVCIEYREGIGHCVVARKNIEIGDVVMDAKPYVVAGVVNNEISFVGDDENSSRRAKLSDFGCPICLGEKSKKLLPGGYCSQECRDDWAELIEYELKLRKKLAWLKQRTVKLCEEADMDENENWILCQTRLSIRAIIKHFLDSQAGKDTSAFDALLLLEAHEEKERDWDHVLRKIAKDIVSKVIPAEIGATVDQIMHMFHVQETNVAQLEDMEVLSEMTSHSTEHYNWRNKGILREGFFLERAIISHACHANTSIRSIMGRGGGFVRITAIEPVKKGDEITTNYTVSAYQPRDIRAIELWDSYCFMCRCPFCFDVTENGCFMRGVRCQVNDCTGYAVPLPSSQESLATHDKIRPIEWIWECQTCGDHPSSTDMWHINEEAETMLDKVLEIYDFDDMWAARQEILKKYDDLLHPGHFVIVENKLQLALSPTYSHSHDIIWNEGYISESLKHLPHISEFYTRLFGAEGIFRADNAYMSATLKLRLALIKPWGEESLKLLMESKDEYETAYTRALGLRWRENESVKRLRTICDRHVVPIRCEGCGQEPDDPLEMMRCSQCRRAFFCNDQCQEAAWDEHKEWCKKPWKGLAYV